MLNSKHFENDTLPAASWLGAITLTPNSHVYALGIIQRTKPWSLIKIRQCMWMLLDASCLSFFIINSSPRHGQTVRDIKNILAICVPNVLRSFHRVWWQSGGKLQRSISNSRAWFFKQPWIADFLLGGAYDMQCEICFGSMRSICVPSFIWIRASMCELYIKFSNCF